MFIKPGPNFKMSKPAKTLLALGKFKDAHHKGEIKRSIVQAELTASQKPPAGKREGAGRK
jgi:hypothetical protein